MLKMMIIWYYVKTNRDPIAEKNETMLDIIVKSIIEMD